MAVSLRPSSPAIAVVKDVPHAGGQGSAILAGMRRSSSEPHLRCVRAGAALKTSRSVARFPLNLPAMKSFFFDEGDQSRGMMPFPDHGEGRVEFEIETSEKRRASWMERLLELRSRWRQPEELLAGECVCGVSYDSDYDEEEEEEKLGDNSWDREKFARYLRRAGLPEAKIFSQLAVLSNLAYAIPDIKVDDLRRWYGLRFVTSSLEKKSIKSRIDVDSTMPFSGPEGSTSPASTQPRRPVRTSAAYCIAASAASYVQHRAKGLLSPAARCSDDDAESLEDAMCRSDSDGVCKHQVAAYMATSTMTAVVAAEEDARREAAKDLRSPHSSPCEWFVCDELGSRTRTFVIQGSDSLASWQANLFFEPTTFEDTGVLVHRGIYEAARGILEQVLPEVQEHLKAHGNKAKLRFTGHSLGGSLALLVSFMLLARRTVRPTSLLPVVTFGAPAVFCGGQRVMEALGLDESQVQAVMMHRDIVPRAFSCSYPVHAIALLKRLNGIFRTHPCLNSERMLYFPLGRTYILQPDDKSSPPHPLLPDGPGLYLLDHAAANESRPKSSNNVSSALRAFLNSPHPLETLSDLRAYGSQGTILRDHESINYAKTTSAVLKHESQPKSYRIRHLQTWWPLVAADNAPLNHHLWIGHHSNSPASPATTPGMANKELVSKA